jgi:hypothetical protein
MKPDKPKKPEDPKLKPCPFCGSAGLNVYHGMIDVVTWSKPKRKAQTVENLIARLRTHSLCVGISFVDHGVYVTWRGNQAFASTIRSALKAAIAAEEKKP